MPKPKWHYYLIDNLDAARGDIISRGLKAISSVQGVKIDIAQGVVEVLSTQKPDEHIQIACKVAGTTLRTKIKRRQM